MAELLLTKGYEVHGVVRNQGPRAQDNLAGLHDQLSLHVVELTDPGAVTSLIRDIQPTEIYNLAAPSRVYTSWDDPAGTTSWMGSATTFLLEAMRTEAPSARMFQASSSEIFRGALTSPQDELSRPAPRSPYGAGKLLAQSLVEAYRARHELHASSGILYNHESSRRSHEFVTRKIVSTAVAIKRGRATELVLGNTSAQRDWGYAPDYVEAMWSMLQQETPGDYVLASGLLHTVDDFASLAFELLDLDRDRFLRSDPALLRVGDETAIVGDPSKARERLGWTARTRFEDLVKTMVEAELAAAV